MSSDTFGAIPPADVPRRGNAALRAFLGFVGAVATGAALGTAWWALAPLVRSVSAAAESAVASDATFVLLAVAVGILHGLWLTLRGRDATVLRTLAALAAAAVGAGIATTVGLRLEATADLGIVGAGLLWPVALLVTVGLAEALRYALVRET